MTPAPRLLLVLTLALGLGACVDYGRVRAIVADSDAVMLGEELGRAADRELVGTDDPRARGSQPDPATLLRIAGLVERIDLFVDRHPEARRTNAALRLRKGLLQLEARRFEAARATLGGIAPADLVGERDRLLQRIHEEWIWWRRVAEGGPPPPEDRFAARLRALDQAFPEREDETPALRDWFEAWRAMMALERIRLHGEGPAAAADLVAASTRALARFDEEERDWIRLWSRAPADLDPAERRRLSAAPLDRLRGFDLALRIAREARDLVRDLELSDFGWPENLAWIEGL